jgi:hypothetical protein
MRDDLRKYQAQYLWIVGRTTFLQDRYFQIVMSLLITTGIFFFANISPYKPYSFILALALIAAQWHLFFSYEKLRARIKVDADEHDPLAYFGRKLDIITQISYIRKITTLTSIFLFLNIWAIRKPEQLFDVRDMMLLAFIAITLLIMIVWQRWKIYPVIISVKIGERPQRKRY